PPGAGPAVPRPGNAAGCRARMATLSLVMLIRAVRGAVLPVGQPEQASVTQCQRSRRGGKGRPGRSIHRAGMTLMRMPMTATGAWPLARGRPGAGPGRLARLRARARHTPALARRHWLFAVLLTAGLVLRILVQIAYRPALIYIDSTKYL